MNPPDQSAHLAALASLDLMGPARLRAVLEARSASDAWDALVAGRSPLASSSGASGAADPAVVSRWVGAARSAPELPSVMAQRLGSRGIRVCVAEDLPERVRDDADAPAALFCTGAEVAPRHARVAVIGTRRASQYGLRIAHELGAGLAAAGVEVVSGLALGIDAAAHAGALEALPSPTEEAVGHSGSSAEAVGPHPVAVIGSGHDRPCPSRNRSLARAVQRRGTLLGEVPPGVPSAPWRFPVRNRLIAALSDVVVVVESPLSGGSMSTVAEALSRDRPVMAVPGPLGRSSSEGCHQLLRDGAQICTGLDDILGMLELEGAQLVAPEHAVADHEHRALDRSILELLAEGRCDVGLLVDRTGSTLATVSTSLVRLESASRIRRSGGWIERT